MIIGVMVTATICIMILTLLIGIVVGFLLADHYSTENIKKRLLARRKRVEDRMWFLDKEREG